MKYRLKPVLVDAVQITAQAFDGDHPNPEHIEGVVYDPVRRCAYIKMIFDHAYRVDIGDWIVKDANGHMSAVRAGVFAEDYEAVNED